MKYRIDLLHYTKENGYTYTKTVGKTNDAKIDLIDYFYFDNSIITNDNEWYDVRLVDNETDEIVVEIFDIVETIIKNT